MTVDQNYFLFIISNYLTPKLARRLHRAKKRKYAEAHYFRTLQLPSIF